MTDVTSKAAVTGYFAERAQAKKAMQALQDASFLSSQISFAVRPEYGASGVDVAGKSAGGKAESVWHKIVSFFEDNCDSDVYSKEGIGPGSYKIAGSPIHGGYGCAPDDFHSAMHSLNISEEHAIYFNHCFNQGEEGALVTVKTVGRQTEAESILERHSGDIGRSAIELADSSDSGPARTRQSA